MGLALALSPMNILIAGAGVFLGIIFGALPGFTATMALAVLIPFTFGMDPTQALTLLIAVYVGCMYGDAIPAILLHTPGTPGAAATAIDGFEMTKKGRAHEALIEAIISSFWGAMFGVAILFLLAPPLARFSVMFGPMETFMLAVFGLTVIASLGSKNMIKALISGVLGLLIGTVGMDRLVGFERYTFGVVYFQTGLQLVPVLIGLFSISQIFVMVSSTKRTIVDASLINNIKGGGFGLKDFVRYPRTYLRSSVIGTIIGIIPGPGGNIASFIGYNEARRASRNQDEFGKGSREGVAGSETANSAITGGALVPMLSLGIPSNSVTAVLLGGLMIHGLIPGHELFTLRGNIIYGIFFGIIIANFFKLFIGLTCAKYFAIVAKVPTNILSVVIIMMCVLGAFAIANSMIDIFVMLSFGVIGYLMRRYGFDVPPMVLGLILGPIGEASLMRGVQIYRGLEPALLMIFQKPICLVLMGLAVISLTTPMWRARQERKKAAAQQNQ